MSLLIDGYNLLHASGILGRGVGPGSLERSRNALLNFIAESLTEKQLSRTTVVFDAREAPPGLPRTVVHRGIAVRFAPRGQDADTVIEELVEAESSPRQLTVVSSDHRLHRAARRRKAKAVDSDVWYGEVIRLRIQRARTKKHAGKPTGPISDVEVRFWLHEFGIEVMQDRKTVEQDEKTVPADKEPADITPPAPVEMNPPNDARTSELLDPKLRDAPPGNPFPPGYAEDIREEDV